jgi:hypothetical protein
MLEDAPIAGTDIIFRATSPVFIITNYADGTCKGRCGEHVGIFQRSLASTIEVQ